MDDAVQAYRKSVIARGEMPLVALSQVMQAIYLASLVGLAGLAGLALVRSRAGRARLSDTLQDETASRFWMAVFITLAGLLINAGVSGALSGVFDRYQGRAAWLAPLLLIVALSLPKAHPTAAQVGLFQPKS